MRFLDSQDIAALRARNNELPNAMKAATQNAMVAAGLAQPVLTPEQQAANEAAKLQADIAKKQAEIKDKIRSKALEAALDNGTISNEEYELVAYGEVTEVTRKHAQGL